MGGPYSQETHVEAKGIEETKRERSVEEKIYTLTIENLDIGLKNAIVGLNNYILWKTTNLVW